MNEAQVQLIYTTRRVRVVAEKVLLLFTTELRAAGRHRSLVIAAFAAYFQEEEEELRCEPLSVNNILLLLL